MPESRKSRGWFFARFFGDSREWQPVGERFTAYSRLYIDLPGHGDSADSSVTSFTATMRCSTRFIVTTY
jgi:pimeloyl-ACP methyl ester carboxylesterase